MKVSGILAVVAALLSLSPPFVLSQTNQKNKIEILRMKLKEF